MVNTFVVGTFEETFSVLDDRRLGKQRVEAAQIIKALSGETKGWKNHPASKMWEGYIDALKLYTNQAIQEWIRRGKNNNMETYSLPSGPIPMPPWITNQRVIWSMQARLIQKDREYYEPLFPDVPQEHLSRGYIWPSKWSEAELNTLPLEQLTEPGDYEVLCAKPSCRNKASRGNWCGVHIKSKEAQAELALSEATRTTALVQVTEPPRIRFVIQPRQAPTTAASHAVTSPVLIRLQIQPRPGSIRVGTRSYDSTGKFEDPRFEGYLPCVVLTRSTKYGSLGPYVLRVLEEGPEQGALIENVWHSFKVVPAIPAVSEKVSRYDSTVAWSWPAVQNNLLPSSEGTLVNMPQWLKWHQALNANSHPIRYPCSFSPEVRASTAGSIPPELLTAYRKEPRMLIKTSDLLPVGPARKRIYFRYYIPAARAERQYLELRQLLASGQNLLLIDVDGPREESLDYYRQTHGVPENWISQRSVRIDARTLEILVSDPKHSCGHTFGLAAALLGLERLVLE